MAFLAHPITPGASHPTGTTELYLASTLQNTIPPQNPAVGWLIHPAGTTGSTAKPRAYPTG